jgi:hypothetical protein
MLRPKPHGAIAVKPLAVYLAKAALLVKPVRAGAAVLNATDSHPVAASPPARRLSESDLQQVADLIIS